MRSNEEIQQMYKANTGLVYTTIHKRFNNPEFLELHGFTKEEIIQMGLIGLHRACRTFDESRGVKFSTHAINYIKWTISDEAKRDSLGKTEKWTFNVVNNVSLDEKLDHVNDNAEVVNRYDLIGQEEEGYVEVEIAIEIEQTLDLIDKKLPNHLAEIVRLKAKGYTMMEIGEMIGSSHQNVSYLLRRHKDKIKALIVA